MNGEYYCPSCQSTRRMREDDPVNCLKCHHIMYWRPDESDARCVFCGAPADDEHYWFCEYWDRQAADELSKKVDAL